MEKKLKLGRWSETEDMYLLQAVNKYGPMDWQRIAEHVPSRAYHQCRDRWINVLDQRRSTSPWSLEEDERLLMGMKVFGRQEYSKISTLLEGRNPHDVRMRVRQLVRYKIEACDATLDAKRVVLHNPSPNYELLRNRREVVLNKYSAYMQRQTQQMQEDRSLQLAKRMGYGSFVSTPSGTVVDYSVAKQNLMERFSRWKVLKDGRWIRWIKNANEYGSKELAREMEKLPEDKQDELRSFLTEVQTCKLVESTYENDKENPQYMAYQRAQLQRTQQRVAQLMGETLTILPM
ncbi:Myb-like DNA-binding domain containing protein [Aphelenchoides avenae]|nr:Myb-like DNA-binding domain containing protein [Aphelenchus avenae]